MLMQFKCQSQSSQDLPNSEVHSESEKFIKLSKESLFLDQIHFNLIKHPEKIFCKRQIFLKLMQGNIDMYNFHLRSIKTI